MNVPDDDWMLEQDGTVPTTSAASNPKLDTDRDFDQRDFLRQHLKIFKDEYREMAHESEQASSQRGFSQGFRRCSTLSRQLGRARGALKALTSRQGSSENIELIAKIDTLLDKIRNVKASKRTVDDQEFDLQFAREALPQFDEDDMDLFLGQHEEHALKGQNSAQIIKAAKDNDFEIMLGTLEKEADCILIRICDLLHSHGICDGFLYA